MIAGLSGGWKVPIGYIYTDKTDSEVQKTFVNKAFVLLEEAQFNVHALISDGNTANVSLFEAYGLKESIPRNERRIEFEDIVTSFPNPANESKSVCAIYDICHMLKLWRNLLAQCGDLVMKDGRVVSWKYLERLFQLQEHEQIRAGNKLNRNHLEFQNHKMNVRLAAQSLSKSNADAIVLCRDKLKLPEFQGSEGTTYFIYLLDQVFDILNPRNPAQQYHKAPLTVKNFQSQTEILYEFVEVVLGMTYTEVRQYKATDKKEARSTKKVKVLCQSARKRAALGFVVSIKSIINVSQNLLYRQDKPFKYVMTYRFSQDLLELFFSKVRGRFGRNDNPNVIQFKDAMKHIWHQNLLKSCNTGNCLEQMKEQIIPAGLLPLKPFKKKPRLEQLEFDDVEELESFELSVFPNPNYSFFYKNCIAYISGNVVRIVGSKLKCEKCVDGLLDTDVDKLHSQYRDLIIVKDKGGLYVPCQSVFRIIEMADMMFRGVVKEYGRPVNIPDLDKKITRLVMLRCLDYDIFPHLKQHIIDYDPLISTSHLHILVREIVLHFPRIRLFDYGKRFNSSSEISIRHLLKKVTLFKGK